MHKRDLILKYYIDIEKLKKELEIEMNGFLIKSISTINIILPHIHCLAIYNDLIKEKIISQLEKCI